MDHIEESGMLFNINNANNFCYIEKSILYNNLGDGIKISEFALIRDSADKKSVWLIEAKSSTPRPESQPNFDEFISDVTSKMSNTLLLLLAAILKRHGVTTELSDEFKKLKLQSVNFKCVLIINGHQEGWLPPIQNALSRALHPLIKTMALGANTVAVINNIKAKELGLIH